MPSTLRTLSDFPFTPTLRQILTIQSWEMTKPWLSNLLGAAQLVSGSVLTLKPVLILPPCTLYLRPRPSHHQFLAPVSGSRIHFSFRNQR